MTATPMPMPAKRELWSGRIGFILANTASAVGARQHLEVSVRGRRQWRQRAFVLFYLLGIALIVLPLMLAELALAGAAARMPSEAS